MSTRDLSAEIIKARATLEKFSMTEGAAQISDFVREICGEDLAACLMLIETLGARGPETARFGLAVALGCKRYYTTDTEGVT